MNRTMRNGCVGIIGISVACSGAFLAGCPAQPPAGAGPIAANPGSTAEFNVNGTYNWGADPTLLEPGTNPVGLEGTITFQQNGLTLQVLGTTHVAPGNRDLIGTGTFVGNQVDMAMTPKNGDTDYTATVRFFFSEDDGGMRFQADFSDTNGDAGTAFGIHQ